MNGASTSASRLGFWAATAVAVFSTAFSVSGLLGLANVLDFPWDPVLPFGASLFLAVAFVVMMTGLHYTVEEPVRLWTHLGLAFAVVYAVLVSFVYFVVTTVVVPLTSHGEAGRVALLRFDEHGSLMQAVDGLGYFFMCVATFCAAFAFPARGSDRWVRRIFLANGLLGVPVLLSYMPLVVSWSELLLPLGALWVLSVPAAAVVAALRFRRIGAAALPPVRVRAGPHRSTAPQ